MALKSGGVGGAQPPPPPPPPPFANKGIRTEFAYCKHKRSTWRRADACFLVQASMAFQSEGVGGGAAPPICKQNDPHSLPLVQT